jgi:hypothetical protein
MCLFRYISDASRDRRAFFVLLKNLTRALAIFFL